MCVTGVFINMLKLVLCHEFLLMFTNVMDKLKTYCVFPNVRGAINNTHFDYKTFV
jgi:hypothetical protein